MEKLLNKDNGAFSFTEEIRCFFANNNLQIPGVFFYEETDSTNTRAKLYAVERDSDDRSPAIFFSHAQCAGKGTRGRTFESPAGGGVYISFLIYPDGGVYDSLALTTYAAVSVCRALGKISKSITPEIKWVNDITIEGKKLSGILTEGKIEDGKMKYAIVGIGVNVKNAEHSPEVEAIMTSLSDCGVNITPDELAVRLTESFFTGLADVGKRKIYDEYKSLSAILGKEVNISDFNGTKTETAIDIDPDFSLITRDASGEIHKYVSGDVSVRRNL